jgi:CHASE3 domain sensor protein
MSKHFCPSLLAEDIKKLKGNPSIHITHLDPSQENQIMQELKELRSNFFKYLNNQIVKKRLGKDTVVFDLNEGRIMMNDLRAKIKSIENISNSIKLVKIL